MICSSIMQVRPPRAGRRTPRHPEEVGERVSMGSAREDEGENERGPGGGEHVVAPREEPLGRAASTSESALLHSAFSLHKMPYAGRYLAVS